MKRPGLLLGIVAFAIGAVTSGGGGTAAAFPHVVKRGETLAQIAERTYGKVEMEQLLVAANHLEAGGGVSIVPGMRLEIPSVGHRRVLAGETWASLAEELLGDARRSDTLALANDSMPWLSPADGLEIVIPYNLRYVAGAGDTSLTIAYRFLGERDKAWVLDRYNRLKGDPVRRGDVLLVPIVDLPLTGEGKAEAASSGALTRSEGAGTAREAQRRAAAELRELGSDLRSGRYVDAIARGNRMLGYGELARPQLGAIQRHLTEAYVALDASGLAETACAAWREAEPGATLDPVELSPKILRACLAAATAVRAPLDAPASSSSAPALGPGSPAGSATTPPGPSIRHDGG